MSTYTIQFPEHFDEYAPIIEAKGWLSEVRLCVDGQEYELTFFEPVRLGQEIESDISRAGMFFEPNVVVVPAITRDVIEHAAARLVKGGRLADLLVASHRN